MTTQRIALVGAGLAGCECALQLARRGFAVTLFEQKPEAYSPAHSMPQLAELVCSNSLRSDELASGVGLIKQELRELGSALMAVADATRVPAGKALAVDRELFAGKVTELVEAEPNITLVRKAIADLEGIRAGGHLSRAVGERKPVGVHCTGRRRGAPLFL